MFNGGSISNGYSILFPPARPSPIEDKTGAKWKYKNIEIPPNCPRCASTNTKFCYYNNYSLAQPRYFCKGCRRYWTKGGSLRNVPVGGGCRKGRRGRTNRRAGAATAVSQSTDELGHRMDIDLAAMFAKYMSKGVGNENYSPGASSGSFDHVPMDLMGGVDDQQFKRVVPDFSIDDINGQEFVYHDPKALDMQQSLLAAELSWSEGTNAPDFGSHESTMTVQDYGMVSPYDQLVVSGNHAAENSGPFDLTAYERFFWSSLL